MIDINTFNQVDTTSLVDRVEAQLVKFLQDQKLKVGDSIPTEMELCKAIGVSRTVVREAMVRLKLRGLIESRKKKGAVITSPDIFEIISKSMNPFVLDEGTLKEIFELRLVLEIGMADLLFERITDSDIKILEEIVQTEPDAPDNGIFQISQEIAFHGKLYEITGNNMLKKFQTMLLPIFDYVHKSGLFKPYEAKDKFVTHKGLVEILKHGSAESFRNAMRNHLGNHFDRLFRTGS
ncbi:FadR family transcriptional regulator [Pedobacter sp. KBW01]|uniref:FadR/GntR family transcriptional regulator n=1 Tax=Pedobacter sp. KBW01 TaxID=2153364 RepID=UPI000F5A4713|nr:FadR/GntR family transcriptional regulator [Pedobacter sp. KBW01]RQO73769.1 FadR family transcriptional regulator [Pedobacter sp. KBW01]